MAPAGELRLRRFTLIEDSGQPDAAGEGAVEHPVAELPTETLQYLLASRYCEVDLLSPAAHDLFGGIEPGWPRVQAICGWVHWKVEFGYQYARPTKTALDVFTERRGVCRDFQHLAITFCRAMNIPARYATGYLGDIGILPSYTPMDFSAWFEVYLGRPLVDDGCAAQSSPDWPRVDGDGPGCLRRGTHDLVRDRESEEVLVVSDEVMRPGEPALEDSGSRRWNQPEPAVQRFGALSQLHAAQIQVLDSAYDEMFTAEGVVRPHYRRGAGDVRSNMPQEEIERRKKAADLSFLTQGITFTVYGEEQGTERMFPYDLVPRVISEAEWTHIERGLVQRITALNMFLHDVYNEGRILDDGKVPREMVYSCRQFRREMRGLQVPRNIYIAVSGTDLLRRAVAASSWCWKTTCGCRAASATC